MRTIDEILEEILSDMTDEELAEKWSRVKECVGKGFTVDEYFAQFESVSDNYHIDDEDNEFNCSSEGINDFCFAA